MVATSTRFVDVRLAERLYRTNEPTYVVAGTTLTNGGVSIQYGDENHMPTREFLIPLYTNTPLSDGLRPSGRP